MSDWMWGWVGEGFILGLRAPMRFLRANYCRWYYDVATLFEQKKRVFVVVDRYWFDCIVRYMVLNAVSNVFFEF